MGAGNPCRSVHVEDFRVGHEKTMTEYAQSARPWSEEDYFKIQGHLAAEVAQIKGIPRLHAARDALLISLEWQLRTRGLTAICWQLHQFKSVPGKTPASTEMLCAS